MKWLDDPPDDWSDVPDEPPSERTASVPLEAEVSTDSLLLREPGSPEAFVRVTAGAVDLADAA